jgi:hypothetical protein
MILPKLSNKIITKDHKIIERSNLGWADFPFEGVHGTNAWVSVGENGKSASPPSDGYISNNRAKSGNTSYFCGNGSLISVHGRIWFSPDAYTVLRPSFGNVRWSFWVNMPSNFSSQLSTNGRAFIFWTYRNNPTNYIVGLSCNYKSDVGKNVLQFFYATSGSYTYVQIHAGLELNTWYQLELRLLANVRWEAYVDQTLATTYSSNLPIETTDEAYFHLCYPRADGQTNPYYMDAFKVIRG